MTTATDAGREFVDYPNAIISAVPSAGVNGIGVDPDAALYLAFSAH
ncbi:hypothetical protein [Nocardia sp. NPDC049707]